MYMGDLLEKIILYIHGKGGSHLEAEQYRKSCPGFDITGVNYTDDFPCIVEKQIREAYDDAHKNHRYIYIIANSIGAYYAMHTLQNCQIERAFFISPVLDMERLILDMMQWAGVTEKELCDKREIPTSFGETLSWEYLNWTVPTEILYAGNDHLTSRNTVMEFVNKHNARLTVLENGEHWFHTEEQLAFLDKWLRNVINLNDPLH